MKLPSLKIGGLVFMALFALVNSQAHALIVGDAAPCVILDGVDAAGKNTHGCIRDTISPKHTHTLIDFFSVYCSTCKANLPAVAQLTRDLASAATVRYVSVDRTADEVKGFINSPEVKQHFNNPVAFDVSRDAKTAYGVTGTPTLFILDNNFTIVYKHTGKLTPESVAEIKGLILGH